MAQTTKSVVFASAMIVAGVSAALAQGGPPHRGPNWGMGPDTMMGPSMMGGGNLGFMCNPRSAGLAEWQINRIETAVKPNDAQKASLADLRTASTKAAEIISATCASEVPTKSIERLALMEKRLDAMGQAVKLVRPAFEAFYASLDDAQKIQARHGGSAPMGLGKLALALESVVPFMVAKVSGKSVVTVADRDQRQTGAATMSDMEAGGWNGDRRPIGEET